MTLSDAWQVAIQPLDLATTNLILLGLILSFSILADTIANRTRLPRISLLVLVGVAVAVVQQWGLGHEGGRPLEGLGEPLIQVALVMVAFLLGGELTLDRLRSTGPLILLVSLAVLGVSIVVVGCGLLLLGFPLLVAVSLAAISVATDPAEVREVIREKHDTRLRARLLMGIVAIDDAWGILTFGLAMALLGWHVSGDGGTAMVEAGWELGGALLLGALIGVPAVWLTGRLRPGEPTQIEAIALILLLAGFAEWLEVSALLAAMFAGALVANFSTHHTRSFNEIEHIEWPFLVFFFVLSGASIDLRYVGASVGLILAYLLLRTLGRYLGGVVAGGLARQQRRELPHDLGLALTPQAGIAMGMALLVSERYPEYGGMLLSAVVASTVVFEVAGPFMVRRVLR
ncbi:cation:proton antiporter [Halomonas sp. MCCC 1A17488]|uniref:Cation:proton antiporter n=1 Tax=Billgrantia sulfidoxydans TaxID=2733484 RepID=A0ABX7W710_9GAMM|nr:MULTISPECIES: cation:proton antiporter [Halomonas]MCE8017634.1 cation:proton antiporter [Halomonas sp. MCCC 1A17488]MCG3240967.1 cation:proton antiporter [Halomonas sp. MCCC 1A17488]QPP48837.1 cation:proton antiporter [Halomonas sp. SS10-MC5]QTP56169.1 cation:proton antiporter [Halomonas sulfidoxydans]